MVQLKYKGQNYILFGKRRIANGVNEIPEEEFYKLMKSPSFSQRVKQRVFEVPKDFPLEKPVASDKQAEAKASSKDLKSSHVKPASSKALEQEDEEEQKHEGKLGVKETLKLIQKSDNKEFLKEILESDEREKVQEAAQKKLQSLEDENE